MSDLKLQECDEVGPGRVMVLGSSRFEHAAFLNGALGSFCKMYEIGTIITGDYSGTDQMVRAFAEQCDLRLEVINFKADQRAGETFFNRADDPKRIPSHILKSTKKKEIDQLRKLSVHCLILLPGPEGDLGETGKMVKRLAEQANIQVFDMSGLFAKQIERAKQIAEEVVAPSQDAPMPEEVQARAGQKKPKAQESQSAASQEEAVMAALAKQNKIKKH